MNKIPIIYYHSVGYKNKNWRLNFLTLELPFFEDQLKYISRNFQTISLKDYWEINRGFRKPIKNALVLTFDDGYLDNWQYAYPLLKKYGLKGTIFVSPEFVDLKSGVRPNLEDVWRGKATMDDLNQWGFLSWEEMREMEQSGVMDIQSHTMSHTKYFVSDKLIGVHRPGVDCLYYIGNKYPERKPYYIEDTEFEKLLPFGYPIFEMQSAVLAKKVEISQEFIDYCIEVLRDYDYSNYKFDDAFARVNGKYNELKASNKLITSVETEQVYKNRVRYEIFESKRIIEEKLNKKVEFLCWPHGDNNELAHQMAMEAGFLATTTGSKQPLIDEDNRIPERIGLYHSKNNRILSMLKVRYKLGSFLRKFPWLQINQLYCLLRYGRFNC